MTIREVIFERETIMSPDQSRQEKLLNRLKKFREQFLDDMGCEILRLDVDAKVCEMAFTMDNRYCHSGDVIQGGFVTAMLDAVTTHAAFGCDEQIVGVSTLELKVNFWKSAAWAN